MLLSLDWDFTGPCRIGDMRRLFAYTRGIFGVHRIWHGEQTLQIYNNEHVARKHGGKSLLLYTLLYPDILEDKERSLIANSLDAWLHFFGLDNANSG